MGYKNRTRPIGEYPDHVSYFTKVKTEIMHKKFDRLLVIDVERTRVRNDGYECVCKCDCGNVKIVPRSYLTRRFTKSCGCMRAEGRKAFYK